MSLFKKTPETPWNNFKYYLMLLSMIVVSLVIPQVFGFLMRWLFK